MYMMVMAIAGPKRSQVPFVSWGGSFLPTGRIHGINLCHQRCLASHDLKCPVRPLNSGKLGALKAPEVG